MTRASNDVHLSFASNFENYQIIGNGGKDLLHISDVKGCTIAQLSSLFHGLRDYKLCRPPNTEVSAPFLTHFVANINHEWDNVP